MKTKNIIQIRKVIETDWNFILKIRNQSSSRIAFHDTYLTPFDIHKEYMIKLRDDPNSYQWIIIYNKKSVGYIKIINSGTIPLTFSDASYGLKVTGLDGVLYYTPMAAQVISTLEPKEEKTFVWNQKRMDGSDSLEGIYKIVVEGFDHENNKVKKSIVINLLK